MAFYKNKTGQKIGVMAVDEESGERITGDSANITGEISKDYGASAATDDVNPSEIDATDHPGVYFFNIHVNESNADVITLTPKSSTSGVIFSPATIEIHTEPEVRESNVTQIGGDTQSATDLKDFADAGYDPSTNKVQGVVLVDTTTTNSDMRGTDNAGLASELAKVPKSDSNVVHNATALAAIQSGLAASNEAILDYTLNAGNTGWITIDAPTGDLAIENFYNGCLLVITDVSTGNIYPNWIAAHFLSGGDAGFNPHTAFTFTPVSGDTIRVYRDVRWSARVENMANDVITRNAFDESTAHPLRSADTGSTAVARTGADGDTLETLSDQVDAIPTDKTGYSLTSDYDPAKTASQAGDAMSLTTNERTSIVNAIGAWLVDGAVTFKNAVRRIMASVAGTSSGNEGANPIYKSPAGTKNRLQVTADDDGNRTSITYDDTDE